VAKKHKFKKSRAEVTADASGVRADADVISHSDNEIMMAANVVEFSGEPAMQVDETNEFSPIEGQVADNTVLVAVDEVELTTKSDIKKSGKIKKKKSINSRNADAIPTEVEMADGSGRHILDNNGGDLIAADTQSDDIAEPVHDLLVDGGAAKWHGDGEESSQLVGVDGVGDDTADGGDLPTTANAMDATQLAQLIEALIFATDKPLTVQRIRQLTRVADVARIESALEKIAIDYTDRGIVLTSVSGGYQFRTRTAFSAWVQQLIAGRPVRLSRAQLETLAIVAYRQPITRPEIDEIRGVDSGGTLKVLLDRQLIRSLGKREEVGRPVLYGTTKEFLDFFSLGDLRELPTLREYSELTDESRSMMKKMGMEAPEGMALASQHLDDDQLADLIEDAQADEVQFAHDTSLEALSEMVATTSHDDGGPADIQPPQIAVVVHAPPDENLLVAAESPVPSYIVDITTDDIESITDLSSLPEVTSDGEWQSPNSDIDAATDDTDEAIP
jgi:segregation and condensation protein B